MLSFLLSVLTISSSCHIFLKSDVFFSGLYKKHFCMLSFSLSLVTADFAGVPLYNSLKTQSHIPCSHARMSGQTAVIPFSTRSFLLLASVDYDVCEFAVGCDYIFLSPFLPLSQAG